MTRAGEALRDGLGRIATLRWTDKLFGLMLVRMLVWVAVAAFSHEGILSDPFKLTEWMDDHQFYAWEEADRMTLLRFGELPAWNPYWCGGTIGIGAPEDPFLGPDFLFRLVFGVAHGRRLAIVFLVVMGFEGTYRLCRKLDASAVGAVLAAVVYGTCDRFVSFIHDGWVNFLGFELIPWVSLCLIAGLASWRWRLLGGFFFAWIVMSAGTYPTPFTLMAVGYLTLALSVRGLLSGERGAWLRPWLSAATIGVVALGICFAKLVPTLVFLRQFPRVFTPVEIHQAGEFFTPFWTRYGTIVFLGLVGAVTADAAAGIAIGGAMLFWALAMGDFGEYAPFHLLKSLPVFSQLRFPDRYMVVVLFFSCVAASRGVTRLQDFLPAAAKATYERLEAFRVAWRTNRGKAASVHAWPVELTWLLIGVATYVAAVRVRPLAEEILEGVHIRPGTMYTVEAARSHDAPFRQHRGNRRDAHVFPPMNMGTLYCVAGNPLPESGRLRGDLPAEEYPADPSTASVKRLAWSPNAITLEVDAKTDARVLVNQNWAAPWRTDVGRVVDVDKMLAVDVPAGKHVVHLRYRDRFLQLCLVISFGTLAALLFVFGRDAVRFLRGVRAWWTTLPTWPDRTAARDPDAAE